MIQDISFHSQRYMITLLWLSKTKLYHIIDQISESLHNIKLPIALLNTLFV